MKTEITLNTVEPIFNKMYNGSIIPTKVNEMELKLDGKPVKAYYIDVVAPEFNEENTTGVFFQKGNRWMVNCWMMDDGDEIDLDDFTEYDTLEEAVEIACDAWS